MTRDSHQLLFLVTFVIVLLIKILFHPKIEIKPKQTLDYDQNFLFRKFIEFVFPKMKYLRL